MHVSAEAGVDSERSRAAAAAALPEQEERSVVDRSGLSQKVAGTRSRFPALCARAGPRRAGNAQSAAYNRNDRGEERQ